MSDNAIVPLKPTALVPGVATRLAKTLDTMVTPSSGAGVFPRISTNKQRFSIVRSGEEPVPIKEGKNFAAELPVVVLAANPGVYKSFYKNKYVPGVDPEAPVCFSNDGNKPHSASSEKQASSCSTCKHNVFGSRISETGANAKACSDSKRLLVVSPKDISGEVYMINVSATALKPWNTYVKMLTRNGVYPQTVVTKMSFNQETDFPQLAFEYALTLPEDIIAQVIGRLDEADIAEFSEGSADTESAFERTAEPETRSTAKVAPRAAAPVEQPAPGTDAADDEPMMEKAAASPLDASVASLLDF